jgi:hypothetical protein
MGDVRGCGAHGDGGFGLKAEPILLISPELMDKSPRTDIVWSDNCLPDPSRSRYSRHIPDRFLKLSCSASTGRFFGV